MVSPQTPGKTDPKSPALITASQNLDFNNTMSQPQQTDMSLTGGAANIGEGGGTGGMPADTKVSIVCSQKAGGGAIDTSSTTTDDSETSPKRETWARKIDFLLACIGFSVGLGNVWRFPYLCYKNGGGAFLIPYFICVILGGIPVFFLEVALGQFMSVGGIGAWAICPLLQGIGFATTMIVFLLNVYYNIILTWAFYYLFSSFKAELPWATCNNPWNTEHCKVRGRDVMVGYGNETEGEDGTTMAGNITKTVLATFIDPDVTNMTSHSASGFDPVTEFWERKVLQISDGIDDVGGIKWDLALCLLLAWVVVYLCIWKGIKTSGKVMYFTATSPYILMCTLLIRGVTLPGAAEGIKFYLIPDWSKLADPQVWVDAGTQIFFSYSISLGTLTALGSYNKFNHNCWKDSIIFGFANSGTSFFSGFVIFSILGFMAHEQGVSVGDVAESGPGLAFIAYPKAVAQMPFAPFWSVLFFVMIILLGLDSQFVGVEGFVTAIVDQFPHYLRKGHRKELFIACVCVLSFLIGLSMVTYGGMYIFQLFDYYSGSRIILVVAFFECLAVAYIYGANRFYDNLTVMLGYRMPSFMKGMWMIVTPIFTIVMFSMCIYSYSELTYNRTYIYPRWAIIFGWMLACSSVVFIPVVAVWKLCRAKGTFKERLIHLTTPKLKPHQLVNPDMVDRCTSINSAIAEVKKCDPSESVPLHQDNGYNKMSLPADENTKMLSPDGAPVTDDTTTNTTNSTSINMTSTGFETSTGNAPTSNRASNNGPAAV